MELQNRVAVVTGGANGIGLALAEAFLAEGAAAVRSADLVADGVAAAVARLGDRAHGRVVDVADQAAVTALVESVETEVAPIDLFVSNAGIGSGMGID